MMHAKDIPRLIGYGNYQVDVDLKSGLERTIQNFIAEDGLELNPDFQRGHVWTTQQQVAFVEYILKGGSNNSLFV